MTLSTNENEKYFMEFDFFVYKLKIAYLCTRNMRMTKTKKILSFLFVALFMGYYANTVFFSHSHVISGASIYHSHIHPNSHHDTQSGNHTEHCITLIAQVSHFQYVEFSSDCVIKPMHFSLYENKFVETAHWITSIHLENTSLRAPPVLV